MKASETVITNEEALDKVLIPCESCKREVDLLTRRECLGCIALCHRTVQAEVSFLAGEKELMSWSEERCTTHGWTHFVVHRINCFLCRQDKKKELGV